MDLATIADRAFGEAKQKAGTWIACRPGCDACCRKPFAITEADAVRLRQALMLAPRDIAQDISKRARDAWSIMRDDFPGDATTGVLDASDEWREWFFRRHDGHACPVLDLATGACRLYHARPVCCRLYGPLITIGAQTSDPCPLCFGGASAEQIEATRLVVALPEREAPPVSETVIAFALRPSPESASPAPQVQRPATHAGPHRDERHRSG
jgi:Fe-S-cluster containining protein